MFSGKKVMCHITVQPNSNQTFDFNIDQEIIHLDLHEVIQMCEHCRQIIEQSSTEYEDD